MTFDNWMRMCHIVCAVGAILFARDWWRHLHKQSRPRNTASVRLQRVPITPDLLVALLRMDGSQHVAFDGLPADASIVDIAYYHGYGMVFMFVASRDFPLISVTADEKGAIDLRNHKTALQVPPLWIMVKDLRGQIRHSSQPSAN